MKLDVARWQQRPGMRRLLDVLGANERLVRFVGGTVRDQLLDIPGSDVDLATSLRPEEVVRRLRNAGIKAVPTGIEHGTVTAISMGEAVEVTTLRRDVSTDGRRATVAFTDDWAEDAARRDFTINALSADPVSGKIYDYFDGIADLERRRVRFIGEPLQRIAEDHLRILRFFRFHARFGTGDPDPASLQACTERANDLMALSRERIADELLKLLGFADPAPTVGIMLGRGIFRPVLPEIEPTGADRLRELVLAELEARIEPDPLRRLSALLPRDPAIVEKVGARLKLSNKARKRLSCAANADIGNGPEELAYRIGVECAADRLLLSGRASAAASVTGWTPPQLPIAGGQLIALGIPQGPQVARTLRAIEDAWIEAGFPAGTAFDQIVAGLVPGSSPDA